jgi:hypothetical protein
MVIVKDDIRDRDVKVEKEVVVQQSLFELESVA